MAVQDKIEASIDKSKLQFTTWLLGGGISVLVFLIIRVITGIDALTKSSEDFNTYIKTNDQRSLYIEQRINDFAERIKELERNEKTGKFPL